MTDSLLPFYNRELAAIRKLASEFAAANPRIAGQLRMTPETVDDPHVERLLEGVAFLAARVQHRLDDELPELSDALLDILCPHLLAPVPSLATVRLSPKRDATGSTEIERGTALQTERVHGNALQYSTCQATTLWPIAIEHAKLSGPPLQAPINPHVSDVRSVLRLVLTTTVPGLNFAQLGLDRLRLHVRGAGPIGSQLLELLCTSTVSVAIADGINDPLPTFLPADALTHGGFEDDEAALPRPQRAFTGQRLLTEYFAFPAKFFYVNLAGLAARVWKTASGRLEIFIYLSRAISELERMTDAENFVLGCTSAVNLFEQPAEPIPLDGTQAELLVMPDARRPAALEVYTVTRVQISSPTNPKPRTIPRFQRLHEEGVTDENAADISWIASRHAAPDQLGGTETRLSLRDLRFDPTAPADNVLTVDTLCCNRDLPLLLPFGGARNQRQEAGSAEERSTLRVLGKQSAACTADFLSPPTGTIRPQLRERSGWRLVSHLTLNHLGLTGGPDAAQAVREMLRLHDLRDTPETRLAIEGLLSVDTKPGFARMPGMPAGGFVRGIDVALTFDPQAWTPGGLFVLASVLARFFALQVSVNGFVRCAAYVRGREGTPVAKWPPRSGTRVLL